MGLRKGIFQWIWLGNSREGEIGKCARARREREKREQAQEEKSEKGHRGQFISSKAIGVKMLRFLQLSKA